jgi:hypothetical protein
MALKFFGMVLLLLGSRMAIYDVPQLLNPSLASASSAVNGGFEVQGHWGALPPAAANVFSSDWNDSTYRQMYNLNSLNPFAGDRGTGYDALARQFTPMGLTNRDFYPSATSFLSNGSPNPYNFDINSPMYKDLYNRYFNFYNTNLNLLKSKMALRPDNKDLNSDYQRKKEQPDSFNYNKYFDGMPKSNSLNVVRLPVLAIPGREKSQIGPRELFMKSGRVLNNGSSEVQLLKNQIAEIKDRILELERQELERSKTQRVKKARRGYKRLNKDLEYIKANSALGFGKDPLVEFGLI